MEGRADDCLPAVDVGRSDMEGEEDGGERGEEGEESDAVHLESAFPPRHITLYLSSEKGISFNTAFLAVPNLSPHNSLFLPRRCPLRAVPSQLVLRDSHADSDGGRNSTPQQLSHPGV